MKKLLSILLALCLLAAFLPPAVSAETAEQVPDAAGETYPFILIRGVDFGSLYTAYGTPAQAPAVGDISAKGIAGALLKAAGKGLLRGSMDAAVDEALGYAQGLMGNLACKPNGSPSVELGLDRFPLSVSHYPERLLAGGGTGAEEGIVKTAAQRYGAGRVYYLTYDWRLNPLDICDDIDAIVDRALAENGAGKVNLVCASMGGIETVAYLSKYGYDKINRCVFLSSTFGGLYIVSDLFCGRLAVPADALYHFTADKADGSPALKLLLKILYRTGAFDAVSAMAGRFLARYRDKIYENLLRDLLGTMPVWWALVLPEDYEQALGFMFGGREEEYAGIIDISRQLQAMVANRDALLREAASRGVAFTVVANYNSPAMPLYERAFANSDGGLETAPVSGGARVAPFGQTLGEGYVPADPARLSPDRVIDASGCLFPASTWFVKDGDHVACSVGSEYSDFLFWQLDCPAPPTVFTDARYPQFLLSGSGQTIAPLIG